MRQPAIESDNLKKVTTASIAEVGLKTKAAHPTTHYLVEGIALKAPFHAFVSPATRKSETLVIFADLVVSMYSICVGTTSGEKDYSNCVPRIMYPRKLNYAPTYLS